MYLAIKPITYLRINISTIAAVRKNLSASINNVSVTKNHTKLALYFARLMHAYWPVLKTFANRYCYI